MIRSLDEGKAPKIAESAWISEAGYVVGEVKIGERSSVWPGAVVRADFSPIIVGRNTHIEDNCVIHSDEPLHIGDNVILGHGVIVHCRSIGNNCLIGSNATLLAGVEIGDFSIVGAGALVLPDTKVPPRSFVVGVPATVRPATSGQVDGLEQSRGGQDLYADLARRYKELKL